MTVSRKPMIDEEGEVREITMDDMKYATRGRPPLPSAQRKKRVNLMLDPDVIEELKTKGNMSAKANQILRDKLGL